MSRRRDYAAPDHPRRCGENMMPNIFRSASQGSPPQVRGKRTRLYCNLTDNRITPAGAGKTEDLEEFVVLQLDHPRRCGENHAQSHDPLYNQGSPPQVRGKLIDFRVFLAFDGITPADAGKTASCLTDFFDVKDHPRGCGENVQAEQTAPYDIGSPPRMRGKP